MVSEPRPLVLGIDEAGRGPVLGPLVLCGVAADAETLAALATAGVRDSKTFGTGARARRRRADLAQLIRERAAFVALRVAQPTLVDAHVAHGGLNRLERALAREIILDAPAPCARIIADGARLFGPLQAEFVQLEAQDHAEAAHLAVAAASIVAKDARDSALEVIDGLYRADFGPLCGGGYPNARTAAFLRAYVDRHGRFPDEVRQSWRWAVLDELRQTVALREVARAP